MGSGQSRVMNELVSLQVRFIHFPGSTRSRCFTGRAPWCGNFRRIAKDFYWPGIRPEGLLYVGSVPGMRERSQLIIRFDLQQPHQGNRVFWERALTNLRKARDRVAQRCDAQRRELTFRVGDLVLVRRYPLSSKVLKRSAKLENRWSNPMVIARL
jgi:hypothetical protein